MIILQNELLTVHISPSGAEVRKVFNKKTELDYMWSGNSQYWGRVSPVLFPIVGRLKRDRYTLDGKSYRMPQHGFLRDVEFAVEEQAADYAALRFDPLDSFLDIYPFRFQAVIYYTLKEDSLHVRWEIINEHKKTMYFSIGAHPAFNVPLSQGEKAEDYTLTFSPAAGQQVKRYELVNSLVKEKESLEEIEPVSIRASLFKQDAFIYSHIDRVSLRSSESGHGVEVDLSGFPFVGIWSSYNEKTDTMAPFVCIEPWYGIADTTNATGSLAEKMGINKLAAGGQFNAAYNVTFV